MNRNPLTTCEAIQMATCLEFDISLDALTGPGRMRVLTRPRFVAVKVIRERTGMSLPEIGRRFGNRDHTTIKSAIERADHLIGTDEEFRRSYDIITRAAAEYVSPVTASRRELLGHFRSVRANPAGTHKKVFS